MSAWATIAAVEAVVATCAAANAILRADRWKASSEGWRLAALRWQRRAIDTRRLLVAEREATLLHNNLCGQRLGAGALERTEPG